MSRLTQTYSSAAPFIREQALNAARQKLNATTIRERRYHTGEMHAYMSALEIMRRSPGWDQQEEGYHYTAGRDAEVLAELTRFMGGEGAMLELGFTDNN